MGASNNPLTHEPSARLVDGSWHIEDSWGAEDSKKSMAAARAVIMSQHGYWRWLKKPMAIWGVLFFLACLAAFAMLMAGLTYRLTIDYVPESFASYLFLVLFVTYVLLLQILLVLILKALNRPRGKQQVYPLTQIICAEEIISELPGFKSELLWQQVSDFLDTKEYFLFRHHDVYFTSIPKRAFQGVDALKGFSDFCVENLAANRVP